MIFSILFFHELSISFCNKSTRIHVRINLFYDIKLTFTFFFIIYFRPNSFRVLFIDCFFRPIWSNVSPVSNLLSSITLSMYHRSTRKELHTWSMRFVPLEMRKENIHFRHYLNSTSICLTSSPVYFSLIIISIFHLVPLHELSFRCIGIVARRSKSKF